MKPDIKNLAKRIHEINKNWWINIETGEALKRNKNELLALVISELCEALEGERKDLMDDHLPSRKMAEVEMADSYIRILDMMEGHSIPMMFDYYDTAFPCETNNKAEYLFYIISLVVYSSGCNFTLNHAAAQIEHYCEKFGYDLWGALEEKLIYNQNRKDHSIEQRKKANGKKF